jgi:glycerol kinase
MNIGSTANHDGKYMLTIDQSTTATKALLVDHSGQIVERYSMKHQQLYPNEGWVEHDPVEIYNNVRQAIRNILKGADIAAPQIAGLTITNQRETALIWDRETGLPIANAIVWQCRRTADFCEQLKQGGHEALVQDKTGLLLDSYFSASKWRWLLDHAAAQLPRERLLAGTIDTWLIWKLTGGTVHATDYTNASRTQLFNIHTLEWDAELAALFGIPLGILPKVYPSDVQFGMIHDRELFDESVPIAGVIGDSQGALFGQQCTEAGMVKGTYGTGTSLLLLVGEKPVRAKNGLVATIAWGAQDEVVYALEAIIHTTGDCLNWVRDQLGLFQTYEELEREIAQISDSGGVYLIPAFTGLGVPYWNPRARAAIIGMNRSSDRRHIMRAALESIAFQVADAVRLLEAETGLSLTELRVDGGATTNTYLMQLQADLIGTDVVCTEAAELSALGSTYMGGLALQFWDSKNQIKSFYKQDRVFAPSMDQATRDQMVNGWSSAIQAVLAAEKENLAT